MAKILLKNVGLRYPILNQDAQSLRSFSLSVSTGGSIKPNARGGVYVDALHNINLEIKEGDKIGLIGVNGSGKSTLLKTLGGIYEPSIGRIITEGTISTLFDLSLGMDYESSAIQNMRLVATLRGISKSELPDFIKDVSEFTELGAFLELPIRTYSPGMLARLGFAIITSTKSEILLIDEVIGVGDQSFLSKAFKRIEKLINKSQILVLASHSKEIIERFCNKAIYLHNGHIMCFDEVDIVYREYERDLLY